MFLDAGQVGRRRVEEVAITIQADTTWVWDNGPPPEGMSRPTSAQQVAAHIRRMIFDSELRTGERVPQDDIAAELGVSRAPVREAVISLDREGWVTSRPHRGAFVNGLDERSTRDHYEVLALVYGTGARKATERSDPETMARLATLHEQLQSTTDPDEFWPVNGRLLRQLLVMAESRRLLAIAGLLSGSIIPGNFFVEVPGVLRTQKRGLRAVTKAMVGGDGHLAHRGLVSMMRSQADSAVSLLASRGLIVRGAGET
jgi:DNA-binding GntR family transcriptional regulator